MILRRLSSSDEANAHPSLRLICSTGDASDRERSYGNIKEEGFKEGFEKSCKEISEEISEEIRKKGRPQGRKEIHNESGEEGKQKGY